MLNDIVKLADHLDMIGEKEEASLLDNILPYIKNVEIDMEEETEDYDTDQNYMLESQLTSISKKTLMILSMIDSGVMVDDWMETYIAQADLMIDNIYDKMATDYHNHKESSSKSCGCKGDCKCNG